MSLNLQKLLTHMQGSWVSQRTIYYLKTKKIKNFNRSHNFKLGKSNYWTLNNDLLKNNMQVIEWCNTNQINKNLYVFFDKLNYIKKLNQDIVKEYECLHQKNQYIEIKYQQKDLQCFEYFYYISKTFRISIGLIKKTNKYIAISFTSEIQIVQD